MKDESDDEEVIFVVCHPRPPQLVEARPVLGESCLLTFAIFVLWYPRRIRTNAASTAAHAARAEASEVPKKEWKEGDVDLKAAAAAAPAEVPKHGGKGVGGELHGGGGALVMEAAEVPKKEWKEGGHEQNPNKGGKEKGGNELRGGAGNLEASEVPKKEWKEGDRGATGQEKHAEADAPKSPSTSLSDITQGEAEIFDENGNVYQEPQVPPPVKRKPQRIK